MFESGIIQNKFILKKFGKSDFGFIIFRRSQSSRCNDDIAQLMRSLQSFANGIECIGDGKNLYDRNADFFELIGNKIRVGIDGIS